MAPSRFPRNLAAITLLAATYFLAGKLGLQLAFMHPSASPVWPPTGIALAAFLFLGYRIWPGIFIGAFLVNLTTAGSVATSIGIAVGNTLEGVVGAYLVNRFAHGRNAFGQAKDVFRFAILAGLGSTMVSATFGLTSLSLGGFAPWGEYGSIWLTWWLGDVVGALIVAPLILLWSASSRLRWNRDQLLEAGLMFLSLVVVGWIIFSGSFPHAYLAVPLLVWAAYRFSPREAITAIFVLSALAIGGTLQGLGPFVASTPNQSLLLLQVFMGIKAVSILPFAVMVSEHRRADEKVRQMAVTDPVTALVNYRRFIQVLEDEISRSQRTGRPFALLLLDLDGLKKINDRYGHLLGTRALCRLADTLRVHCRAIDTAARYGGDEFALLLVETGEAAAHQVVRRIGERLATDTEKPVLSVSVGVAVYPQDGDTVELLLGAADRALYDMKRRGGEKITLPAPSFID